MIRTEADFAKLTHRQHKVLTAFVQQLSSSDLTRFSHIAEATANIDAKAFLQMCASVQKVLSRPENTNSRTVSDTRWLASLETEQLALSADEKTTDQLEGGASERTHGK